MIEMLFGERSVFVFDILKEEHRWCENFSLKRYPNYDVRTAKSA